MPTVCFQYFHTCLLQQLAVPVQLRQRMRQPRLARPPLAVRLPPASVEGEGGAQHVQEQQERKALA